MSSWFNFMSSEDTSDQSFQSTKNGGLSWALGPSIADCAAAGGMTPVENFNQSSSGAGVQSAPPVTRADGSSVDTSSISPLKGYASQGAITGLDPQAQAQAQAQMPPQPQVQYTKDGRTNPGQLDKADREATQILKPDITDGCRFEHTKLLGQNFNVTHSLWLGTGMIPSGSHYQFGSTLVLNEGRTMLLGRIDPDLRLDAQWHHEIIEPQKLISRVVLSLGKQKEQNMQQWTLEQNGLDYAATLKIVKGPLIGASYFQSITKSLSAGAEAFYHHGQGMTHIIGRTRYANGKNIATATYTTMGEVSANYVRRVSDRVGLAAEFQMATESKQSQMTLGYEFLMRTAKISGVISPFDMVYQTQITEMIMPGFAIIFNGILDHKRNAHRFGIGAQIG